MVSLASFGSTSIFGQLLAECGPQPLHVHPRGQLAGLVGGEAQAAARWRCGRDGERALRGGQGDRGGDGRFGQLVDQPVDLLAGGRRVLLHQRHGDRPAGEPGRLDHLGGAWRVQGQAGLRVDRLRRGAGEDDRRHGHLPALVAHHAAQRRVEPVDVDGDHRVDRAGADEAADRVRVGVGGRRHGGRPRRPRGRRRPGLISAVRSAHRDLDGGAQRAPPGAPTPPAARAAASARLRPPSSAPSTVVPRGTSPAYA